MLSRRDFTKRFGLAALAIAPLASAKQLFTQALPSDQLFSAYRDSAGDFGIAALDTGSGINKQFKSPGRPHAIVVGTQHTIALARRPGTFAMVLNNADLSLLQSFTAAKDRHFYGHGVFSADASLFFTTENDYQNERGVIGIRSVAGHYRQIEEWPSHDIGPHELLLAPDGSHLIVANGGILTHPDSGRAKLNLDSMSPSLVRLDITNGALLAKAKLPADHHRLSIRHIDVTQNNDVIFGMQNQAGPGQKLPLVGVWRAQGEVQMFDLPASLKQGYIGSVAVDRSGTIAAASAPRDNLITFWSIASGELLATLSLNDGCGLAAGHEARSFIVSSGQGRLLETVISNNNNNRVEIRQDLQLDLQWDNHLS